MDIGELLSGLNESDIDELKKIADEVLGGGQTQEQTQSGTMPDLSALLGNAELLSKLTSVMAAMNRRDPRSDLIAALKPLLSEKRRQRADSAARIIKLLDLLPILNGGGQEWI